jgi:hypothetical protein
MRFDSRPREVKMKRMSIIAAAAVGIGMPLLGAGHSIGSEPLSATTLRGIEHEPSSAVTGRGSDAKTVTWNFTYQGQPVSCTVQYSSSRSESNGQTTIRYATQMLDNDAICHQALIFSETTATVRRSSDDMPESSSAFSQSHSSIGGVVLNGSPSVSVEHLVAFACDQGPCRPTVTTNPK